jgi:hypothetical protein
MKPVKARRDKQSVAKPAKGQFDIGVAQAFDWTLDIQRPIEGR